MPAAQPSDRAERIADQQYLRNCIARRDGELKRLCITEQQARELEAKLRKQGVLK